MIHTTSPAALVVQNLEKVFKVYGRPVDAFRGLVTGRQTWREHRAIDGISFEVPAGQTLGIVGRNGAGKSTLLKIIAGTLYPSDGLVNTVGRVSAILELGSGFHPEFSGRENIFLGGLCLGLTRREVEDRFDEIVAFSELGDVLDRPFRTYSTGMQARLSFSVAAAVDSNIMIVDEALSVGDARFQRKCFKRFEDLRKNGTTILLVSHNMSTIVSFCDRAILLEKGKLIEDSTPQDIDRAYQKLLFHTEAAPPEFTNGEAIEGVGSSNKRFGNGKARIVQAKLYNASRQETTRLQSGESFKIEVEIDVHESIADLAVGLLIRSPKGIDLFGVDTASDPTANLDGTKTGAINVSIEGKMNLAQGEYFVTVGLAHTNGEKIDLLYDALHLRVAGTERLYSTSLVNLSPRWNIKYLGRSDHSLRVVKAR